MCHLQDVNRIYRQFSGFVKQNRPNIDIEAAMDAMAGFDGFCVCHSMIDPMKSRGSKSCCGTNDTGIMEFLHALKMTFSVSSIRWCNQ